MVKTPTIGILETGRPPGELAPRYGNYPDMVTSWLNLPRADFRSFAVLDGEIPQDPAAADLWVVTGSKFGVYEGHDWIAPAEAFIRACRDADVPMVGICFGHQLIAQALGGVVEKSSRGWGLGVHRYGPVNWPGALGQAPETIAIQAFHQDQVITPPEVAEVIAESDFCPFAALWYPGFALSVQGHPEFDKPFAQDLLEARRRVLPDDAVEGAKASFSREVTRGDLARIVRDYLMKSS